MVRGWDVAQGEGEILMHSGFPGIRVGWLLFSLATFACLTLPGWTQMQLGNKDTVGKPFDDTAQRRNKLMSGEEKPTPADQKVADAAAKWYLYRITWNKLDPGKVQSEFADFVKTNMADNRRQNQLFIQKYLGPALVESMKEVLANSAGDPAQVINACLMMPSMARLRQDNIGDYLISLGTDDKTHPVIRVYALKALKDQMPVASLHEESELDPKFDPKRTIPKKDLDARHIETLAKYIEKPVKINPANGQQIEVVRYLRREAITALAHAGVPAVTAMKKLGKVEGPVAPTLLKVLTPGGIQPPPSLQEKIEAAHGLCTMKYPNMPEYLPDVAVYLIGQTLLETVKEYNKNWDSLVAKGPTKKLPTIAWKTESKQFEAELKELVANAKGTSAKANAEKLEALLTQPPDRSILKSMSKYEQTDRAKVLELENGIPKLRPKTGKLFKTLKSVEIPLN